MYIICVRTRVIPWNRDDYCACEYFFEKKNNRVIVCKTFYSYLHDVIAPRCLSKVTLVALALSWTIIKSTRLHKFNYTATTYIYTRARVCTYSLDRRNPSYYVRSLFVFRNDIEQHRAELYLGKCRYYRNTFRDILGVGSYWQGQAIPYPRYASSPLWAFPVSVNFVRKSKYDSLHVWR